LFMCGDTVLHQIFLYWKILMKNCIVTVEQPVSKFTSEEGLCTGSCWHCAFGLLSSWITSPNIGNVLLMGEIFPALLWIIFQ
jgi:hypothetical protein